MASHRWISAYGRTAINSLRDLSAMAYAVLVAAYTRFLGRDFADAHACGSILLPPGAQALTMEHRPVVVEERPALATIDGPSVGRGARCAARVHR